MVLPQFIPHSELLLWNVLGTHKDHGRLVFSGPHCGYIISCDQQLYDAIYLLDFITAFKIFDGSRSAWWACHGPMCAAPKGRGCMRRTDELSVLWAASPQISLIEWRRQKERLCLGKRQIETGKRIAITEGKRKWINPEGHDSVANNTPYLLSSSCILGTMQSTSLE